MFELDVEINRTTAELVLDGTHAAVVDRTSPPNQVCPDGLRVGVEG